MAANAFGNLVLKNVLPIVGTGAVAYVGPKAWDLAQKHLLNGTSQYTENWTELAKQGKLGHAYGREALIDNLRTAIANHAVVILEGPPGCGKSALMEKITYMLLEEKVGSRLHGVQVLSLNSKVEGEPGVKGLVTNIIDGGTEKRIQAMVEHVKWLSDNGEPIILFWDEMQDVLRGNLAVLNKFKPMLARPGIRIVGATTNAELIKRWLNQDDDGVGLERRVEVIHVPAMEKEETKALIETDFERIRCLHEKIKFVFEAGLSHAIVELSELVKPNIVLPDRAIKLLNDLCESSSFNSISDTIDLGRSQVEEYVAKRSPFSISYIREHLDAIERRRQFSLTFDNTYFPLQQKAPTAIQSSASPIQSEVECLSLYFTGPAVRPCLILKGCSKTFLREVISQWGSKENYDIYRCDVRKLARDANSDEGISHLRKAIETLCRKGKTLLVLENCSPTWLGTIQQAESRPVRSSSTFLGRNFKDDLNKVIRPLGTSFSGLTPLIDEFFSTSEAIPEQQNNPKPAVVYPPAIIRELFQLIEILRLPCIAPLCQESPTQLMHEKWDSLAVHALSLQETTIWLNDRYRSNEEKQAADHPLILKMVLALHCLKDAGQPLSVLELAAQAVDHLASKKNLSPADAILKVFGGSKSREQIEAALREGDQFLTDNPFTQIACALPALRDERLEEFLFNFLSSDRSSILGVVEKTRVRQQCYTDQIALHLQKKGQRCVVFDHRAMRETPPGIRDFAMQKYMDSLKDAAVVIVEEEGLKNPTLRDIIISELKGKPQKIVVFKTPEKSSQKNSDLVERLVEAGSDLIGARLPSSTQPASIKLDSFFHGFENTDFIPSNLTEEETGQLFKAYLKAKNVNDNLKPLISSLYLLLVKQGQGIDYVLQMLSEDIDRLAGFEPAKIFEEFTQLHGKALKMTLTDVKYEVDPSLTSFRFRGMRMIKNASRQTMKVMTMIFKWVMPLTAAGIFSTGGSWLFRRIFLSLRRSS